MEQENLTHIPLNQTTEQYINSAVDHILAGGGLNDFEEEEEEEEEEISDSEEVSFTEPSQQTEPDKKTETHQDDEEEKK